MSLVSRLLTGGVTGVLEAGNGIVKTIWGSKQERDSGDQAEQMSVQAAFAAQMMPRDNRTYWDSLVDGINRLPRPAMTFGIIYLFYFCLSYPAAFATSMTALAIMPAAGWALMATVTAFWFGGKYLRDFRAPNPMTPEQVKAILEAIKAMKELEEKEEDETKRPEHQPDGASTTDPVRNAGNG